MLEVILYIGLSQFVFAALLTFTKRRVLLPDRILGLWLLLMCIFMGLTLAKNELPDGFWGRLQLFPFFFTIGPFLFWYVRTLAAEKTRLDFSDNIHLLPFAVFSTIAVLRPHPVDEDIVAGRIFTLDMIGYSISALISFFYYLSATFIILRRHRKKLLDHFSYLSRKISLKWVWMVTAVISGTLILTMAVIIMNVSFGKLILNPGIPLFLGFTIFGYGVSFFGVRQPAIYVKKSAPEDDRFEDELAEDKEAVENEENGENGSKKYERSGLRETKANEYADRLMVYMESKQPYLRRDLTIQDVADDLEIPVHHLTQTINEFLEKNFYTLVNEYRVEEVKKRLLDPKYGHLTVLAIAHDAGFNSKSSFNMTFKKMTGLTPSEYKRQQRN